MTDYTHIIIDKETHREMKIASDLKHLSMGDIVRESFKIYKIKYRLEESIKQVKYMQD